MTKEQALKLIDNRMKLSHPIDTINWEWLRVAIYSITDEEWETIMRRAVEALLK